jgi:hypothetical protein
MLWVSFTTIFWLRSFCPFSIATACFTSYESLISTYPNAGETPATVSRTTRMDWVSIPLDSTQSWSSRSEQSYGIFTRNSIAIVSPVLQI